MRHSAKRSESMLLWLFGACLLDDKSVEHVAVFSRARAAAPALTRHLRGSANPAHMASFSSGQVKLEEVEPMLDMDDLFPAPDDDEAGGAEASGEPTTTGDFDLETALEEQIADEAAEEQHTPTTAETARPGTKRCVELVCSACFSRSSDSDLADPTMKRPTPFGRLRATESGLTRCDHCEYMMRYQRGSSTDDMSASPAKSSCGTSPLRHDAPNDSEEYLNKLAVYIALKYTEEQARVHKVTLERTAQGVGAHSRIAAELHARAALRASSASSRSPAMVYGLKDYILNFGNPLNGDDRFIFAQVSDQAQVCILRVGHTPPSGLHSLRTIVEGASQGVCSQKLDDLAGMSIDCMDQVALVGALVSEFSSRATWMQRVATLATPAHEQRSEASSKERQSAGLAVPPTPTARTRRQECEDPGSPMPAHTTRNDAGSASQAAASSTLVKHEFLGSPQLPNRCSARSFRPSPSASAPAASSQSSARSVGAPSLSGAPSATDTSTPRPARSPGSAQSTDRAVEKVAKRVYDFAKLFTPALWKGSVRGKDSSLVKFIEKIADDMKNARAARREDKLPRLEYLKKISESMQRMLHTRANPKGSQAGPRVIMADFFADIGMVMEYLEDDQNIKQFGEPGGGKMFIDPGLRKLQASLPGTSLNVAACAGLNLAYSSLPSL